MFSYIDEETKSKRKNILITGAGSGLGKGAALKLAKTHNVIAAVEIWPQYSALKKTAENLNIKMDIVKLDIIKPPRCQ